MVRIPNVIYTKTDKTYKCVDLSKRVQEYEWIPSGKITKCD